MLVMKIAKHYHMRNFVVHHLLEKQMLHENYTSFANIELLE